MISPGFHLWLSLRFVTAGRHLLTLPAILSLVGMAVSVACLTVAMAVVSGYEKTLETAIIDVFGHVQLMRHSDKAQNLDALLGAIKDAAPEAQTFTPFMNIEGLMVGGGQLAGVLIQGIDAKTVDKVLSIRSRVIKGAFAFEPHEGAPSALVGKALAKKFGLKVGELFKLVIPMVSKSDSTSFSPRVRNFYLSGVLDLGKAEYDERTVLIDLKAAQSFAEVGENFSGIRIKLSDSKIAPDVAMRISRKLGPPYFTMDWTEVNKNLFEAVRIERTAIFFVILVLVVAACFNIASGLFVSVLQRYGDISILRAMGLRERDVAKIFVFQGLFFGVIGTLVGVLLGVLLGYGFVVVQRFVVLLPVEAYRLDHVGVDIRMFDLIAIVIAATVICLLSTLIPARRGARLDPVQGLRYE